MRPRLTASPLEKTTLEAFKVSKREAAKFADAIYEVMKEARLKNEPFKTGQKLDPAFKRICEALEEQVVPMRVWDLLQAICMYSA